MLAKDLVFAEGEEFVFSNKRVKSPRYGSKPYLFLELATTDRNTGKKSPDLLTDLQNKGCTRWVAIEEFEDRYAVLKTNNGVGWIRDDTAYFRHFEVEKEREGVQVVSVRLSGFREEDLDRSIRPDLKRQILAHPCVMTGTHSSIEADHKHGRRDSSPESYSFASQDISMFQPLNRNINLIKRTHCVRCKNTGKRFDARNIGSSKGWLEGNEDFTVPLGCRGCFWQDPQSFLK